MPELRLVVLALEDRLAYGPTFSGGAGVSFRWGGSSLSSTESTQSAPASKGMPEPSTDINALIAEAGKDFADYQRLTAEGKLGEAGQKLDELKSVLYKLNGHEK
jgi:hypothetical protein